MSFAISPGIFEEGFDGDGSKVKAFTDSHGLDGIEMILYGDHDPYDLPEGLVKGYHLLYWPNWLDLWHCDHEALLKDFMSWDNVEAYYGFTEKEAMKDHYRKEFRIAKDLDVAYMVLHASHAGFGELFSLDHRYGDREVLEAILELVNEVFVGDGPMLLFENLWWPGLTYRNVAMAQWFLDKVNYRNKGFVLDVSHLMATEKRIRNTCDGIEFVKSVVDDMGTLANWIKVIHLNKTIAGPYLSKDHGSLQECYESKENLMERFTIIGQHIGKIDSHEPFEEKEVKALIERIKPLYLVHELKANDRKDLVRVLETQKGCL